jgi:hypothetical protein
MIRIGKWNNLKVTRDSDYGLYLDGSPDGEILLPNSVAPENLNVGDTAEVFVYFDSEDRLVATTEEPIAQVDDIAVLQVVAVNSVGAFLDWGLPKDLFLPYGEQSHPVRVGQDVVVHVGLDKSGRIAASMRLGRYLDKTPGELQEGQAVDLLIVAKTDLGFKAIINSQHTGVIYENEVFQPLEFGQFVSGFIKKIRPDGKIDLSLQRSGFGAAGDIAPQIMALLDEKGGFLAINDKTPAEEIYKLFGVSKKKYKMALGALYRERLISVSDDGIRKVSNSKNSQ